MSGTVTHNIAQFINNIIRPYLNNNYIVKSTDEFLLRVNDLKVHNPECLMSLDVENLFTNVPVHETIDIIIEKVYNSDTLPPPKIDKEIFKKLMIICTTKTPFKHNGETYVQIDGVSMGSPLGPTFADFYMSYVENSILSNKTFTPNPTQYYRYVDDTFVLFKDPKDVEPFIEKLQNISKLKFTYEKCINKNFHFLDVNMKILQDGSILRSVYVKNTDKGIYSNYKSHLPEKYKTALIKTLIYRSFKITSTWETFTNEVNRITKRLINNNFPQYLIEKIINNTVSNIYRKNYNNDQINNTKEAPFIVYYNSETVSNIKEEEKKLEKIIKNEIITRRDNKIIIRSYFKPTKLSSQFTTRDEVHSHDKHNVVYQFTCSEDGCNATYIGYTTNTLKMRMYQHKYKPSNIHYHLTTIHGVRPSNDIYSNFNIITHCNDFHELRIAESLWLKKKKPLINIKENEMLDFLNVF